jgi:hypothetical protein
MTEVFLSKGPNRVGVSFPSLEDRNRTSLGKVVLFSKKIEITAVGIHHADHVAPSIHKSWH